MIEVRSIVLGIDSSHANQDGSIADDKIQLLINLHDYSRLDNHGD